MRPSCCPSSARDLLAPVAPRRVRGPSFDPELLAGRLRARGGRGRRHDDQRRRRRYRRRLDDRPARGPGATARPGARRAPDRRRPRRRATSGPVRADRRGTHGIAVAGRAPSHLVPLHPRPARIRGRPRTGARRGTAPPDPRVRHGARARRGPRTPRGTTRPDARARRWGGRRQRPCRARGHDHLARSRPRDDDPHGEHGRDHRDHRERPRARATRHHPCTKLHASP
jgi:hypothetical protein